MCHPNHSRQPIAGASGSPACSSSGDKEVPAHIMKQYGEWRERVAREFLENPAFWENSEKEVTG